MIVTLINLLCAKAAQIRGDGSQDQDLRYEVGSTKAPRQFPQEVSPEDQLWVFRSPRKENLAQTTAWLHGRRIPNSFLLQLELVVLKGKPAKGLSVSPVLAAAPSCSVCRWLCATCGLLPAAARPLSCSSQFFLCSALTLFTGPATAHPTAYTYTPPLPPSANVGLCEPNTLS